MLAQGEDYCMHFNLGSFHNKNGNFMQNLHSDNFYFKSAQHIC